MHYQIIHRSNYQYTVPVSVCHNLVRLAPRHLPRQVPREFDLRIGPEPVSRSRRLDYFGNQVDYFTIQEAHRELEIVATSLVNLSPPAGPVSGDYPWETIKEQSPVDRSAQSLEAHHFTLPTDRTAIVSELRSYAAESFTPGRPILAAVDELVARIHADFVFDPLATTVNASTVDLLSLRRGVCQDFAHFAIGCVRAMGLPARYVSGYVCTVPPPGMPRLMGADASHAWFSVFTGPGGWIDYDPTNNLRVGADHITLAWGRDYGDICPIQGVFVGGGQHSVQVSVDVLPEESEMNGHPHLR